MADNKQKKDLNEATQEDLENLPFMNTQRARLIIDYRANNGPFETVDQIDDVTGIGEKLSRHLSQYFIVGEESASNRRRSGSSETQNT